jgi:hypothetical protein
MEIIRSMMNMRATMVMTNTTTVGMNTTIMVEEVWASCRW